MKQLPFTAGTSELIGQLRQRVARIEGNRRPQQEAAVSTGFTPLDDLLPAGGLRRGTLVEWFPPRGAEQGGGAGALALVAARAVAAGGGALVVMDRERWFYPPAAAAWGVDLAQVVVIRAAGEEDELWALDQVLRCQAVAAVWAPRQNLGGRDFRRLQLAAEAGGAVGMLLRPPAAYGRPSWAHLQLLVEPRPLLTRGAGKANRPQPGSKQSPAPSGRRLRVKLLRARGRSIDSAEQTVELEIDERTGALRTPPKVGKLPTHQSMQHRARAE